MPAQRPIEVRLSEKYSINKENGCWDWIGSVSRGYGYIGKDAKTNIAAHKFSYLHHVGPVPSGMLVLHRCNNSLCVNPAHLKLGTHADNMADMKKAGTRVGRNAGTTLSAKQVAKMKRLLNAGLTQQDVADAVGINRTTVQRMLYSGRINAPPMKRVHLTDEQRREVRQLLKDGEPILRIAQRFNVDRRTIRNIRDKT